MNNSSDRSLPRFLYKYRSLGPSAKENTLSIIKNRMLWAACPLEFNDPFDCVPQILDTIPDRHSIKKLLAKRAQAHGKRFTRQERSEEYKVAQAKLNENPSYFNEAWEDSMKMVGVISLAKSYGNFPMWAHYADNHEGICIEIDTGIDGSPLEKCNEVVYGPNRPVFKHITHANERNLKHLLEVYSFLLHKAREWEYEGEWRYICNIEKGKKGRLVRLPPSSITRIIVGAKVSDDCQNEIEGIVKQSDPNIEVVRAKLDQNEYNIVV